MRTISKTDFDGLIAAVELSSKLKNGLKFEASTLVVGDDWLDFEIVPVADRTGAAGVLLLQPDERLFIVQYALSPLAASSTTGRVRSIICDFCYTWQRGSNAASITLTNRSTKRSVRYLSCGDMMCSRHVRTQTEAGRISRTQLRESLDDAARVERLKRKLIERITDLELKPIAAR